MLAREEISSYQHEPLKQVKAQMNQTKEKIHTKELGKKYEIKQSEKKKNRI